MKMNTFSFKGITIERDVPESDVPCNSCADCCSVLSPFLTDEEFRSGKYIYTFIRMDGCPEPVIAVPRAESGACVYLVNNRCSIYNRRPLACRQFDCRSEATSHPKIINHFQDYYTLKILGQELKIKLHTARELTSDIIRRYGGPDITDMSAYVGVLEPGDTCIDVGANIGVNAVFAGKLVAPTGKVYAFEPDPDNFRLLQENITLNNLDNVVIAISQAVGDRNKKSNLYKSRLNYGDHMIDPDQIQYADVHTLAGSVDTVTLDSVLANQKIKLIKIDVQGSEVRVLQGAQQIIREQHPVIVMEYSPYHLNLHGVGPEVIYDFIDHYGYQSYIFESNSRILSRSDLVATTRYLLQSSTHIDLILKA